MDTDRMRRASPAAEADGAGKLPEAAAGLAVHDEDADAVLEANSPGNTTGAAARLYKRVARHILEMLGSKGFRVGDRLPAERELVAAIGVSRPVVREALLALEVLGYVDVRIGSGCYVTRLPSRPDPKLTDVSLLHTVEALLIIESECLRIACENVSDARLATLGEVMGALGREQSPFAWMEALLAFHMTAMSCLENPAAEQAVYRLWHEACQSELFAAATFHDSEARGRMVARHEKMLEALGARDPALGRESSRQFFRALLNDLIVRQEEREIEQARLAVREKHTRFLRATGADSQEQP